MVTNYELPPMVEIPVEGCKPLMFSRENMSHDIAWLRLALDHDMTLGASDFADQDDYYKYFFVACGLMDYACAIIYGNEGGGKSLVMNLLTYQILRLFKEKRGTLDFSPPKRTIYLLPQSKSYVPESENEKRLLGYLDANDDGTGIAITDFCDDFGVSMKHGKEIIGGLQIKGLVKLDVVHEFKRCDRLKDAKVVEQLQEELNITSEYDDEIPPQILNSLLVYNRVFGCDECDRWGDKSNRTNFTKLMGRLINRRRHYHTTFLFVYIDAKRVDQSLIWDRRTHTIFAQKVDDDLCEYRIFHRRTGKTHWMYLHPSDWTHIWDSHNISAVSHSVKVDLSASGKKKDKETTEE